MFMGFISSKLPYNTSHVYRSCMHGAMNCLPYFARGEVVKGFGRGSKQLGIPTGKALVSPATRPYHHNFKIS